MDTSILRTMPMELRFMTYNNMIAHDQALGEYVGNYPETSRLESDHCTPLLSVKPPAILRTCRELRSEYLGAYFANITFRINVDLTSRRRKAACLPLSGAGKDWIASLQQSDNFTPTLRSLQFRFTNLGHGSIGANLNIVYNSAARTYACHFQQDQGWDIESNVGLDSNLTPAVLCPRRAWRVLKRVGQSARGECLNLEMVERMYAEMSSVEIFERTRGLEFDGRFDLVDWQDEMALGPPVEWWEEFAY